MATDRAWNIDLGDPIYPLSIVCTPDGSRFAATGDGRAKWQSRIWDLKTGKRLAEFQSDATLRFRAMISDRPEGHELAFSPDGKSYATVKDQSIQLFDVPSQRLLHSMRLNSRGGGAIEFAFNGKILVGQDQNVVRFWDTNTGREMPRPAGLLQAAFNLQFADNGKTLVSGESDGIVHAWDSTTGRAHELLDNPGGRVLAISRDGRMVATEQRTARGGSRIQCWDLQKKIKSIEFDATPIPIGMGNMGFVASLGPTGRDFAFGIGGRDSLELHDTETRKVRFRVAGQPLWGPLNACCFTADGNVLATHFGGGRGLIQERSTIALYDTSTGNLIASKSVPVGDIDKLAFSPDGKWLVGFGLWTVHAWEVATLQPMFVKQFHFPEYNRIHAVEVAWDGRILAVVSVHNKLYPLLVIDLGSLKTACTLPHEFVGVPSFAFSPGGKRLAAGTYTPDILVWDLDMLATDPKPGPVQKSQKELGNQWRDLGARDSAVAFQAQQALWQSPQASITFLKDQLRPSEAPAAIEPLIAALDSQVFKTRDEATNKLEELGRIAEASVRSALAGTPSAEKRRRLAMILEHITGIERTQDELRQLRMVQLLEQIGNKEAVAFLESLAAAQPISSLTLDAKSSLKRLAGRMTAIP